MLIMQALARVLFEMQPLDANFNLAVGHVQHDHALADHRLFELADLVALRQVRVKIVLTVEGAHQVDLRLEAKPGAYGLRHALFVDDRQHARHGGIDEGDMRVGGRTEARRCAREQLGVGRDLRVHFKTDNEFPGAGSALQAGGYRRGAGSGGHGRVSFRLDPNSLRSPCPALTRS